MNESSQSNRIDQGTLQAAGRQMKTVGFLLTLFGLFTILVSVGSFVESIAEGASDLASGLILLCIGVMTWRAGKSFLAHSMEAIDQSNLREPMEKLKKLYVVQKWLLFGLVVLFFLTALTSFYLYYVHPRMKKRASENSVSCSSKTSEDVHIYYFRKST